MKLHTAEGAILDVEQVALDDAPVPKWILPAAISESEFATASLAPPCIVEHYLYADVGVLIAPGGTGKTMLRLYECICIVLGIPLFSLTVRKPGPVLILTAEDSREMLVARLRAIADAMQLSDLQCAIIRRDIRIFDVSADALKLTIVAGDIVLPAPAVDCIIEQARPLAPVLVQFDPAISFGVGEARVNDAEQGLIEVARRIRRELGCCVRYVHHSGKANAHEKMLDQYAGRGGSTMADGARMVAVLQPLSGEEWAKLAGVPLLDGETGMVLARPKLSYSPPAPDILISRKGYAFSHTTPTTRTTAEELEVNCAQILSTNCCHGTSAPRYSTNNASGVAASALSTPNAASAGSALANVPAIIDSGGQIMVGTIAPVKGAAVAHDGEKTLVMLRRRPREPIPELLARLDAAIAAAQSTGSRVDEINTPSSDKRYEI